jgi:hypothetical protein
MMLSSGYCGTSSTIFVTVARNLNLDLLTDLRLLALV